MIELILFVKFDCLFNEFVCLFVVVVVVFLGAVYCIDCMSGVFDRRLSW